MHYYCKTHSSPPFPPRPPLCQPACELGAVHVYLLQRVGPHPLQDILDQSWQTRKPQTLQSTHLCSFLHCLPLLESFECLSYNCQMSFCPGLSWVFLPHSVYCPCRARKGPVLVWEQVEDENPWLAHMPAHQDLVGPVLLLLTTPLAWCIRRAKRVSELVLKIWILILVLPLVISEPTASSSVK